MRVALREARKGLGRTSPNPATGAVIVRDGEVVAKGHHKKAGSAHAEVEALNRLGGKAPGATLYVTLEPCNHVGRTPPCTQAVLESGIQRVVIGMRDPNPDVDGGGCETLTRGGVEVEVGVLEEECRQLNEAFLKFVTFRRPFVILKSAMTLDGWTGSSTGNSKWITNQESRGFVHKLRDQVDAVMVGVGTVISDNPFLTTRLPPGRRQGRDALRIVVDTRLRTPVDSNVIEEESSSQTIIAVAEDVPSETVSAFEEKGVWIVPCPLKDKGIDLMYLMETLGKRSVMSILVEGGATLAGSLIRESLVDKFHIFISPKIFGGSDGVPMARGRGPLRMEDCLSLGDIRIKRFGSDILITGYPVN